MANQRKNKPDRKAPATSSGNRPQSLKQKKRAKDAEMATRVNLLLRWLVHEGKLTVTQAARVLYGAAPDDETCKPPPPIRDTARRALQALAQVTDHGLYRAKPHRGQTKHEPRTAAILEALGVPLPKVPYAGATLTLPTRLFAKDLAGSSPKEVPNFAEWAAQQHQFAVWIDAVAEWLGKEYFGSKDPISVFFGNGTNVCRVAGVLAAKGFLRSATVTTSSLELATLLYAQGTNPQVVGELFLGNLRVDFEAGAVGAVEAAPTGYQLAVIGFHTFTSEDRAFRSRDAATLRSNNDALTRTKTVVMVGAATKIDRATTGVGELKIPKAPTNSNAGKALPFRLVTDKGDPWVACGFDRDQIIAEVPLGMKT